MRRLLAFCLLAAALLAHAADVVVTDLPNGLRLLVKEVHAAPVVTVDMWYKAGSRNERPGITGASHLLEHMTYKGTDVFPKDDMRALVKRNGAVDNGATFYDYTHYHTTIARDRVELPIRIEAARMSGALIKQEDLDQERTVVRSELEGNETNPGAMLFQQIMAAAYTAHPYQWPVIGWRADIEHTTADELRAYYRTYYIPNNATLVVVGDVDAAAVAELARKHLGAIPRGAEPPQWVTPEPAQTGERRVTVRRQGRVPMEFIAYHVPAISHVDVPALLMLDQVIGTGRTSRLYRAIVDTKHGVNAFSSCLLRRDASIFYVGGIAAPGQPLAPIEKLLLEGVTEVIATPPTAEEMARGLRQLEASLIYERDSVTGQTEQLGYYETVAGDWRYPEKLLAALKTVTPADVSRVAKTYLTEDNRTVGTFQPTAPPAAPVALGPVVRPFAYRSEASARMGTASIVAPLPQAPADNLAPVAGPVKAPVRQRIPLPNGMVLVVQENRANPTVAVSCSLRAGKGYDLAGKAGVAELTAQLLDRGTKTRTGDAIAAEMEGAAAEISAGTGWETVGLHGKALAGDTELLLRNLADLLRNPIFPADGLDQVREQMLADLAMERDDPAEAARRAFYRAALPANHPYRLHSFDEEEAGLKALTPADLAAFHKARYTPRTAVLTVVGDVSAAEVRTLVERYFGDWRGDMPALLAFPPTPQMPPARVITRIADKTEVDIYVGHAGGLRRTDPNYYAAELMNMILGGGGALNSRLGDVIRDQNGLAYSVYSGFHASTGAGPWYAVLGVNPANTDKAIDLLKAEITRMRNDGATQQEIDDARAYLTGASAIALGTNAALANTLLDTEYFSLGLDYPERLTALYGAVTREQVNAAAKTYLHPDNLTISIAGPYGQ